MFTADDMQRFYWYTPFQRRDQLLEQLCFSELKDKELNDAIRETANLGRAEQTRRKALPLEFVECPYCKGYHDQFSNDDKLCEKCEWTVHILRWDVAYKNKT
jgi:hypothetical protein